MHTKGPWYFTDKHWNTGERPIDGEYTIRNDDGMNIALVLDTNEAQTNALLIAAAPELLEVLEYLVEQYPNNRGMNKAREAIRKAKESR